MHPRNSLLAKHREYCIDPRTSPLNGLRDSYPYSARLTWGEAGPTAATHLACSGFCALMFPPCSLPGLPLWSLPSEEPPDQDRRRCKPPSTATRTLGDRLDLLLSVVSLAQAIHRGRPTQDNRARRRRSSHTARARRQPAQGPARPMLNLVQLDVDARLHRAFLFPIVHVNILHG